MSDSPTPDPTKRIPKSLDTETKLLGSYTMSDLVVALLPAAVVVLLTRTVLPTVAVRGYTLQALSLPLAVIAFGAGALFVYLTPAFASSLTWLSVYAAFRRDAPTADYEEATEYTGIERVYPEYDAIARTDGTLVGAVHVTPPTMALATTHEWARKAEAFEDFLNTTVEFPIQLYATTQPFPVDQYIDRYEERLTDPDVTDNPVLEQLIETYVDWYRGEMDRRHITIRDHYVLVPVRPDEVHFADDDSIVSQLAELPYIGLFVHAWLGSRVEAERTAQATALKERTRHVERGLREIQDCDATRVDAAGLTDVVAEYWGEPDQTTGDTDATLRTTPLVGGVKA